MIGDIFRITATGYSPVLVTAYNSRYAAEVYVDSLRYHIRTPDFRIVVESSDGTTCEYIVQPSLRIDLVEAQ